ncbi:putative lipopolysaccharide glycosyltransferase [Erwinia amylovora Ea644]|uniref:hypothetical protein n=1 Tax=Erwinia amylovora TaxID=552 RepID=UPI0002C9ED8B|nr:hypothetical protein [Erwinia amylovora]CCP01197.1 putative lipopolysaccharide glycosyltransferase [Erwinia amylovora Ea644]CCP05178.1 lipopolysaccharide core biosynthesis protein RfaZ [Erwinia amylovora MR1]
MGLFKQIYRYTRPRRLRHNENLWPYVKITRGAEGHISSLRLRGRNIPIINLSELRGRESGDLLLVASGPSIKVTDFTPLQHLPTIGVNGAWFMHQQLDFRLYVIVDMTFIDQRPQVVKEIVSDPQVLFFTTVQGVVKVIERFGFAALRCQVAVIEDACVKTYQPKVLDKEIHHHYQHENSISFSPINNNIAFSHDIRKGIFDAGTVVYWALQIVQFMGYSRIIIAGLDMNNFQQPRFYESNNDQSPSYLQTQFSGLIEPAFTLASSVLNQHNVKVLNLSLNSALSNDIFQKVTPYDI